MEAASLTPRAAPWPSRGGRLLRLRTDDQLVALLRSGNQDAFRVIHDRYRPRLLAYTRQMLASSSADAEDALQDVFLRAYGTLRADDRPVSLRAWLYRVAHNRCVDQLRRPANQPSDELADGTAAVGAGDPQADLEQRDDLRRLVADVRRLPEQQRSALLMREMEGLSYLELADALGVTVPAVKSLLVRARIGLVEAREARDTTCAEIRTDLASAQDRGVRADARSRRHLQDCSACSDYRAALRRVRAGVAALGPPPSPWALAAKLLGLGGAGGGAAATTGGGGATAAAGLVAAGGTAKVAALVCAVAVVGGSAVEATGGLQRLAAPPAAAAVARPAARPAAHARGTQAAPAPAPAWRRATGIPAAARPARPVAARPPARRPHAAVRVVQAPSWSPRAQTPVTEDTSDAAVEVRAAATAGGALAPDDTADAPTSATTPAAEAAAGTAPADDPAALSAAPPRPDAAPPGDAAAPLPASSG